MKVMKLIDVAQIHLLAVYFIFVEVLKARYNMLHHTMNDQAKVKGKFHFVPLFSCEGNFSLLPKLIAINSTYIIS